jgi:hypothetical protein
MRYNSSMTQRVLISAGLLCILTAAAISVYGIPAQPPPRPTQAPTPTPFVTWLVCDDCAEIGMRINVWTNPGRGGVAGQLPPRTLVTVTGSAEWDGLTHYRIWTPELTGWVSELLILEP